MNLMFSMFFQESRNVVSRVGPHAVQYDIGSVVGADTVDFFQDSRVISKFRRRRQLVFLCTIMCVYV